MNKMSMAAIAVLLVSVMFIGAQSRKTLGTVDVATIEAMEHQRILAELEEVHQLRERMLQQGKVDVFVPIKCPDVSLLLESLRCCWDAGVQATNEVSTVAVYASIKHLEAVASKQTAYKSCRRNAWDTYQDQSIACRTHGSLIYFTLWLQISAESCSLFFSFVACMHSRSILLRCAPIITAYLLTCLHLTLNCVACSCNIHIQWPWSCSSPCTPSHT